ncbi:2Fe-2S iron-sulfur cluster-binding protein [Ottowia thiooxydans]|uniref:Ferredoxin n=1 Tax=Ottowia thiooxydans TaxID=219182 RepID=A0ABV2Q744_9BURK
MSAAVYTITLMETGESYRCAGYRSVLEGMEALGKKGIPVGCRNGGCGVCKVQVIEGQYTRRVMSREHVSAAEELVGRALSCRIKPTSDLRISVLGQMKKNVCRLVEPVDDSPTSST